VRRCWDACGVSGGGGGGGGFSQDADQELLHRLHSVGAVTGIFICFAAVGASAVLEHVDAAGVVIGKGGEAVDCVGRVKTVRSCCVRPRAEC